MIRRLTRDRTYGLTDAPRDPPPRPRYGFGLPAVVVEATRLPADPESTLEPDWLVRLVSTNGVEVRGLRVPGCYDVAPGDRFSVTIETSP